MDETNLEFMRNNWNTGRLVLIPLSEHDRPRTEQLIDDLYKQFYKTEEVNDDAYWTWMDSYGGLKRALTTGNVRLDDYKGDNLNWWESRICSGDDLGDYLIEYVSIKKFLNFISIRTSRDHVKLSENAQTMANAIDRMFVHYVEYKANEERMKNDFKIKLVKANED